MDDGDGDLANHHDTADEPVGLAAEIVVARHGPAECTLFPPDATDLELMTHWITAREGSFASLEDMR
ncbi:MAG: transcriptional regulator [Halobacteriaceae archaeon]